MKRFFALILIMAVICSLTACGEGPSEPNRSVITERLLTEIAYNDELSQMDASLFDYLYSDVDAENLTEYSIYIGSGATSEEVATFSCTDENAAKATEEALRSHVAEQKEGFEGYIPEEAARLDNAVLIRRGKYVFLSVSGDPEKAKKIINE